MAKIGWSACGGESRDDAHRGDGASCGDRGAAEAGQGVAIGAPATRLIKPSPRMRLICRESAAGLKPGTKAVRSARRSPRMSNCGRCRARSNACSLRLKKFSPLTGRSSSRRSSARADRGREPRRWGRRGRPGTARIVGSSRAGCRAGSIRLIDRLLERRSGASSRLLGPVAMFHPAMAPEEGDIVRRGLDAQHEMELVVHLRLTLCRGDA